MDNLDSCDPPNSGVDLSSKPVQSALAAASVKQARLAAASGFLHDLSNAIMGICSMTETSCDSLEPDDPLKANLTLIHNSAFSVHTKLRQIIDLFRSKTGERILVNLSDTVSRLDDLLRGILPGGAKFRIDVFDPELPLKIDENYLKLVLLHFAMNASVGNSSTCLVTITLRRVPAGSVGRRGVFPEPYGLPVDAAELAFSDTSGGIDPELLPGIFEPFTTTKENWGGMGLGLYFARCFAQEHSGQLGVINEEGKGATFLLLLPLENLSDD